MGRNYNFPEQTWRRSGSCPEGTIPVRRKPVSTDDDIANRTLPFFSYTRPASDIIIQDEGTGKLEVSGVVCIMLCVACNFVIKPCNVHSQTRFSSDTALWDGVVRTGVLMDAFSADSCCICCKRTISWSQRRNTRLESASGAQ